MESEKPGGVQKEEEEMMTQPSETPGIRSPTDLPPLTYTQQYQEHHEHKFKPFNAKTLQKSTDHPRRTESN